MKRILSRILTAAMVVGLLTVSALAYDLPDNTLLEASNPSSGSVTVTGQDGENYTVYRYPAGTVFTPKSGMTNFQYVNNLSTGESQYLNQSFTLPETGAYELVAFDQGIWSTEAYAIAEGAPIPEPEPESEPEVTWYETPDNGWIYSDAVSTGSVTVTDGQGINRTVYQYPAGTSFSIQSGQMSGSGAATVFLTNVYDLTTGEVVASPTGWTLPSSGYYKLEAYDSWGGPNTFAYVTAEGAGQVQPEPEPEPETVAGFADVPVTAWYAGYVETVVDKGLFSGKGEGVFGSEDSMTYAEFLVVLSQFSGDAIPGSAGAWYQGYVDWANNAGIVPAEIQSGFNPDAPITRQDMAALFGAFLDAYEWSADPVTGETPSFADQGSIAGYAADGVTQCYQLGIMSGKDGNTFDRLHRGARFLADIRPTGYWPASYFHAAGGLPRVMEELRPCLQLDALTVTGKTLGENLDDLAASGYYDRCDAALKRLQPGLSWREVIHPYDTPLGCDGSIAVLYGNLAPKGAVVKHTAVPQAMHRARLTARPFDSEEGLRSHAGCLHCPDHRRPFLRRHQGPGYRPRFSRSRRRGPHRPGGGGGLD